MWAPQNGMRGAALDDCCPLTYSKWPSGSVCTRKIYLTKLWLGSLEKLKVSVPVFGLQVNRQAFL